MGMDVYGKSPSTEVGEYFRRSVWSWHPLWTFVEEAVPHLAERVTYGHTNDGDGLDAEGSVLLAHELTTLLDDGTVARYVTERDAALAAMASEPCQWCNGTGTRTDKVGVEMGMVERGWCNGCDGKGEVRPWAASYGLEVQDVAEFRDFLTACGGFEIC